MIFGESSDKTELLLVTALPVSATEDWALFVQTTFISLMAEFTEAAWSVWVQLKRTNFQKWNTDFPAPGMYLKILHILFQVNWTSEKWKMTRRPINGVKSKHKNIPKI